MDDEAHAALQERRRAYVASLNLGSGFVFRPTEKQLICKFLIGKIRRGDAVREDDLIKDLDVYSMEPWDIWNGFSQDELSDLYFYTKLKRKPSNNKIDRGVAGGKGRWQGETSKSKIQVNLMKNRGLQEELTCIMNFVIRKFRYRNAENAEQDGHWIMTEYRENRAGAVDWVIFHLRRDGNSLASSSPSGSPTTSESGDSTCTDDEDDDNDEDDPKRPKISDTWQSRKSQSKYECSY